MKKPKKKDKRNADRPAPGQKIAPLTPEMADELVRRQREIIDLLAAGKSETAYERALALPNPPAYAPGRAELLAVVCLECGRLDEAEKYAREFRRLKPDGDSRFLVARVRFANGERGELIGELKQALGEPLSDDNRVRCHNLLGQIYRRRGEAASSAKAFYAAFEAAKNLSGGIRLTEYDNYLFNSHYLPYEPQEMARKHFRYNDLIGELGIGTLPLRRRDCLSFGEVMRAGGKDAPNKSRIRIGYVSPDLREHVVLSFSYAMFRAADREKFELFAYCHAAEDAVSEQLKTYVDNWRNIAFLEDDAAAAVIAADDLDLLVDLSGHTKDSVLGIVAYRPAPIIVSGIGYFSTTGLKTVDYFLSDIYLAGASESGLYSSPLFAENLLVLPRTHWCYCPLHPQPPASLEAPARKNGYVTFGSFNAFAKANDEVLAAWKAILDRVPDSRLVLKSEAFDRETDAEFNRQRLKRLGFDLNRVDLRPATKEYIGEYADIDIALDTFPYGGGATTLDALYMSVPVIALIGGTHHARFGYSILRNIGLGELACPTVEEYIGRAASLAGDLETLDALHAATRSLLEKSPLMDEKGYMADLEAFYRALVEDYRARETAADSPTRPNYQRTKEIFSALRQYCSLQAVHPAAASADAILAAPEASRDALRLAARAYIDSAARAGKGSQIRKNDAALALYAMARAIDKNIPPVGGGAPPDGDFYAALPEYTTEGSDGAIAARAAQLAGRINLAAQFANRALSLGGLDDDEAALANDVLYQVHYACGDAPKMLAASAESRRYALAAARAAFAPFASPAARRKAIAADPALQNAARNALDAASNYVYNCYFTAADGQELRAASEQAAAVIEEFYCPVPYEYGEADRARRLRRSAAVGGKIRLAFITPDFGQHVVARFLRGILDGRDKQRFEISIYFTGRADRETPFLATLADHFIDARAEGLSVNAPAALAARIHDDDIDILIELSGHSANHALAVLAYRPAPIIVSAIGFMGTTGLKAVDYFLSDIHLAADCGARRQCVSVELSPPSPYPLRYEFDVTHGTVVADSPDFTEKLLVLPHSHWCYACYDMHKVIPPPPCRQNGHITFGSLNKFAKASDAMLCLWSEILRRVPNSRIFLKGEAFDADSDQREIALARLRAAGIADDCIITEGYDDDYLAAYQKIDIALDTFPYVGGGTTADALFMGVPVISLIGQRHGTRFGLGFLENAGIAEECAAFSETEYVEKAVRLAGNPARIAGLRQTIRAKLFQTPVFNEYSYMGLFESALETIFARYAAETDDFGALGDEFKRLVYAEKFSEAHSAACRLLACDDRLDIHLRGMIGLVFLRNGANGKAIAVMSPLLAAAKEEIAAQRYFPPLAKYLFYLADAYHELCLHIANFAAAYTARLLLPEAPDPNMGDYCSVAANLDLRVSIKLLDLSYIEAARPYEQNAYEITCPPEQKCAIYSGCIMLTNWGGVPAAERYELHRRYEELCAEAAAEVGRTTAICARPPVRPKKLRVGYLSGDFRESVIIWFIYQIICAHDRGKFEIICFSTKNYHDDYTALVEARADEFVPLYEAKTIEEKTELIREKKIDILFDLAGHTVDGVLPILYYRAAPVQISGLGYMTTTGLSQVDYFVTDRWTDPPETRPERFFSEKLLYLPSMFCYTGRSDVPVPTGAPVKKCGHIQFASFNTFRKVNDNVLRLWKRILDAVPDSRLLIKSQVFYDGLAANHVRQRLAALDFDNDRIDFEAATNTYMNRYLDVDIHLDSFPYLGGGTTADALYMGVPVIARRGEQHSSRFADSFLSAAGVPELLAASDDEYVEKAVALARDIERLNEYHRTLRDKMMDSALMDTPGYIAALEAAYRRIYDEWYDNAATESAKGYFPPRA